MAEEDVQNLLAIIGMVLTISLAYGRFIGPYQMRLTEMVVSALGTPSHLKPVVNFAMGLAMALALTIVAAMQLDTWAILPAGVLAGVIAASEAGERHDAEKMPIIEAEAYHRGQEDMKALVVRRREGRFVQTDDVDRHPE